MFQVGYERKSEGVWNESHVDEASARKSAEDESKNIPAGKKSKWVAIYENGQEITCYETKNNKTKEKIRSK